MQTSRLEPGDTVLVRATVKEFRDGRPVLVWVTAKELIDVDIIRGATSTTVAVQEKDVGVWDDKAGRWRPLLPGELEAKFLTAPPTRPWGAR